MTNLNDIKALFDAIERSDIDANMQNLVSDNIIDSLDIMGLVAEIEKKFNKPLSAEFIEAENFESFEALKDMLNKAFK